MSPCLNYQIDHVKNLLPVTLYQRPPLTKVVRKAIRAAGARILFLVADVAAIHADNSVFINTENIEFDERVGVISNNGTPEEWVSGFATLVSLSYPENWTQEKWDKVLISTEKFLDEYT